MLNTNAVTAAEHADYHYTYAETTDANHISSPGVNFSEMLAEAVRDETARMMAMTSIPNEGGTSAMPQSLAGMTGPGSSGIEQMILASASTGEASNAQIALFMLMMMMQSSEGGDTSMLSMMMNALLPQLDSEAASFKDNTRIDTNAMRLSSISTGLSDASLPLEVWQPATPRITSSTDDRSPERYRSVVNQFRVESAERYRPFRDGHTYCNIFVLDVTRAMGAYIPHVGAIAMCNWFGTKGEEHGWREVDAQTAQMHANEGKPAVTSAGNLGHVQMVIPSRDGNYDPVRGVAIAQAGSVVSNYTHITSIYSNSTIANQIRYFIHD